MASPNSKRFNNSLNPMFGNLYNFSIAELSSSFTDSLVALTTISTDTTSPTINHGGQGVELLATFSDANTTCSIDVSDNLGNLLKTFKGVSLINHDNLFVTYFETQKFLNGIPITVRAYNFTGSGNVSINVRKTA